jgi:Zn-dependent protease
MLCRYRHKTHAAAAHALGGEVRSIVVLPFQLRFRPRRLTWAGRGGRGDVGGYVTYRLDRIDARRKHALIAAAGPSANLALALLAILGVAMAPHLFPVAVPLQRGGYLPTDDAVRAFVLNRSYGKLAELIGTAFAVLSAGVGIANIIPFEGSDGAHILRLWRGRAGT